MPETKPEFEEIHRILNARSLAIVGASNSPEKFGYQIMQSNLTMGFKGPIYPVNRNASQVLGFKSYPSVADLPESPDVVYLTIPAHRSMDILKDCASRGTKCVVIIASGFREIGEERKRMEEEALKIAREGGFRIIGPNCFGIYNPRNCITMLPGHDLSKEFGDVAFISQSGGFAVQVARLGNSLGINFSAALSYGNAADIGECDLLRYFSDDPDTNIIGCYIEGTQNGTEFKRVIEETAAKKPLIVWKAGDTEVSRRAVLSHTGSLAGESRIWDCFLRSKGAMRASGVEEMVDAFVALKHIGRNPGRRLLIAGGGGGLGTYGADKAIERGLEIPPLSNKTLEAMRKLLGYPGAVASNPLDIGTPITSPPLFRQIVSQAVSNDTTDVFLFDLAFNLAYPIAGEDVLSELARIFSEARQESGKPIAVSLYSRACGESDIEIEKSLRKVRSQLLEGGIAVFGSTESAIRAISIVNSD